jgi:hypothetical protein
MASTLTTEATALARLQAMLDYTAEPALTLAEVQAILDEYRIASVYAATPTQCLPGVCVVPTVLNGRWYISRANDLVDTNGGTAYTSVGTTEPDWPRGYGYQVTDGNVLWEDIGPAPVSLWDLNAAAYEGWGRKAASIAGGGSLKAGSLSIDDSAAHATCLASQSRYMRAGTL